MPSHPHRATSRHLTLVMCGIGLLSLIFMFATVARGASTQIDPTEAPGAQLQANPTEPPQREPGGFQANPTEPPSRIPDDVQANPTEPPPQRPPDDIQANPTEPPRDPGDFQANPTEVPTEDIDDIQANPTAPPAIDDEAIPTTGTVRVVKKDCPLGVVEDAILTEYLKICFQPHDGVEFVVNDVNGAQSGTTVGGQVEWTGVDPGVFNITETIPAGYGDPIVFCGYTESPGGGVQHPVLQASAGGVVEGTFPDAMFEFVCYWMNVPTGTDIGGPDSVANPGGGTGVADLLVVKRVCPNDIPPGQGVAYYLDHCTATVDGVEFTVSHGNGSSTKSITNGEATWTGLPLGPFTIEEDIPVQFGEPIVFCGWTAIHEGIVYDAFSQQIPADGGLIEREITIPNTYYFCYVMNVEGAPGDLVDPGSYLSSLVLRKWTCPDGTPQGQDRDFYIQECQLMLEPVEFTLGNADGEETRATSGGFAEWDLLPTGEFTLQEILPAGYGAPVAFCGWYAYWGGFHYDAFPALVPSPGGLIEGEITVPNTDYFCDVVNIEGEIDDITANPTAPPAIDDITATTAGTVRVIKRDCPPGVAEDATLAEYLTLCPSHHDGVEYTLETSDGTQQGTTAAGQVEWTDVPAGPFTIQESIPPGYTDPIVHCGFTESPGGGVQHPSLQDSTDGLIGGTLPEPPFEYVCYVMNIKSTGTGVGGPGGITQDPGDPDSTLTVTKRICPAGTPLDQDPYWYLDHCTEIPNGTPFTLINNEGSSTKPVIGGIATWEGLPTGPWTLEENIPGNFGEPLAFCGSTAFWEGNVYDDFVHLVPSPGGVIEGEITVPNTSAFCYVMNMPATPGSFENPQDTTNTLVARKWHCPAGIEDAEPAEVDVQMDYYLRLCEQEPDPVEFTLANDDGASTQATSGGKAQWDDVPPGPFTLQETIPAGYGEPKVFCGWTAFYMGAVYDGFHQPVPSTDGLIENEISIPNTHMLCHYLNIPVEIDDIQANPAAYRIIVYPIGCPEGVGPEDDRATLVDTCDWFVGDVMFTLINEGANVDYLAEYGSAEWEDIELGQDGTVQIHEEVPTGYDETTAWCFDLPIDEGAEDWGYHQVLATDGTINVQPNQEWPHTYSCFFYNFAVEGAGQGGPAADIEIEKSCPTIPDGAGVGDEITYQVTIANTGDVPIYDIDVIETREGAYDAPFPTELGPGESATRTFTSEITPEDVANGNVNNSAAVTGSGDIGESTTDLTVEINADCALEAGVGGPDGVANPGGGLDQGTLVVKTWTCPSDVLAGQWPEYYHEQCDETLDGLEFTLTTADGSSTIPIASGVAQWTGLPAGAFSIQQTLTHQLGDPIVFCGWTAFPDGNPFHQFPTLVPAPGGLVEGELIAPETNYYCEWMNVESGPDDVTG